MSLKANPVLIGGFIIGAVVLAFAGTLLFGSGKLFRDTAACVMYFDGDVQGLSDGAAVKFRGVKIGQVTSIKTKIDRKTLEVRIPVYVDLIDPSRELYGHSAEGETGDPIKALIERGLRAQLQVESLVTGQLFVQLDFYPDAPPITGPVIDPYTERYEIPTVPTIMQKAQTTVAKVLEKLERLPLEKMLESLDGALAGADRVLSSPDLLNAPAEFVAAMAEVRRLVKKTEQGLGPLLANADAALVSIDQLARDLRPLVRNAGGTLVTIDRLTSEDGARLVANLNETATTARLALEETRQTMASMQDLATPTSAMGYQLTSALKELAGAARAMRMLADVLEQQPDSVIFGKHERGTE